MNLQSPTAFTIDELSRDIGIGKDTLRVWERRYGFPQPLRNEQQERIYPPDQVERLRTISRLLDSGHRPGKVVPLSAEAIATLANADQTAEQPTLNPAISALVGHARAGDSQRIQRSLQQMMSKQGPLLFILDTAAPLMEQTGKAWADGQLSIYMEHLITQHLRHTLSAAGQACEAPASTAPKVLLTTLPGERHGMGLMMVELLLRAEKIAVINLGTETPVDELRQACADLQPDILALSFSSIQKRPTLIAALRELNDKIPASVTIVAGGEGVSRLRALPERIRVVKTLEDVAAAMKKMASQRQSR